jgi:hypothetical protein
MPRSDGEPIFFLFHRKPGSAQLDCIGAIVTQDAADMCQQAAERALAGSATLVDAATLTEEEIASYITEVRLGQ